MIRPEKETEILRKAAWTTRPRARIILFYSTVLLLLLYYLYLSWSYTIDYPLTNDILVVALKDVTRYATDADYGLLDYLFQKKNHHILFFRFHAISSYLLTGSVDIKLGLLQGNLLYLGLLIAFTFLFKNYFDRFILLLILGIPIAHIFVNLATNSNYYLPGLFFYFAIRLLSQPRPLAFVALLIPFLLILMVYSFGNGILCPFLLIVYVLYLKWKQDISAPVFWLTVVSCLLIGGYYLSTFDLAAGKSTGAFRDIWQGKLATVIFPFAFCGSYLKAILLVAFDTSTQNIVAAFGGLVLVVFAGISTVKKINKDDLAVGLVLLLIFLSGVLTAYGRCELEIFCTPLTPRYEQYGLFFIAFIYLLTVNAERKKLRCFLIGLVLVVSSAKLYQNSFQFQNLFYTNNEKKASWRQEGAINYYMFGTTPEKSNNILKNAITSGIYDTEEPLYRTIRLKKTDVQLKRLEANRIKIKIIKQNNKLLHLKGQLHNDLKKADIFVCEKEDCFKLNYWVQPEKANKTNFSPFYSANELLKNQSIQKIKNKLYVSH